jgi:hypothetical protein
MAAKVLNSSHAPLKSVNYFLSAANSGKIQCLFVGDLDDVGGVDVFPVNSRRFHFRELYHDGAVNSIVSVLIVQREIANKLDALELREFAERALCEFFRYIAKSPNRGCFVG